MTDNNGWIRNERFVLEALVEIKAQLAALREDVQDLMTERKALHMRVAFIAAAVAAAVSFGGRAVYEIAVKVLF